MKDQIIESIDNPTELEKLYHSNKYEFSKGFDAAYLEIKSKKAAHFWKARLDYKPIKKENKSTIVDKTDLYYLLITSFVAYIFVKWILEIDFDNKDADYSIKLVAPIVIYSLFFYNLYLLKLLKSKYFLNGTIFFLILTAFNFFASSDLNNQTDFLRLIHLPLLLWLVYGLATVKFCFKNHQGILNFIKYNGDLAVMMAILMIASGIFVGITAGLFELIHLDFQYFFQHYLLMAGMVGIPMLGSFVIQKFPNTVGSIAPLIANIFSPLVIVTLLFYLGSLIWTDADPFTQREFLIIFNVMLVAVMALIIFNLSNAKITNYIKTSTFILSLVTIAVDLVALSAIIFRFSEYGFTPNRLVVLIANVVVLGHLLTISFSLFKIIYNKYNSIILTKTIAQYIPVYMLYLLFVIFVLPLIS